MSETESNDLHGMVPDSNDTVLLLIDVINHLDFEGNEGCTSCFEGKKPHENFKFKNYSKLLLISANE